MKLGMVVVTTMCLACAGTASAGWPMGIVGAQVRQASPWAYQAYLGSVRSIPPQVKNQMPIFGAYPGRGIYSPWQRQLAYQRSIPPQVRNSMNQRAYRVVPRQAYVQPQAYVEPQDYAPPQAYVEPQAYAPPQAYVQPQADVPTGRQPQIRASIDLGPGVTAPRINSIIPYAAGR